MQVNKGGLRPAVEIMQRIYYVEDIRDLSSYLLFLQTSIDLALLHAFHIFHCLFIKHHKLYQLDIFSNMVALRLIYFPLTDTPI